MDQPAELRLQRRLTFDRVSYCYLDSAPRRNKAVFSSSEPLRIRLQSHIKVTSSDQYNLFSIPLCERTA
jgi:hypothetical protein